METKSPVQSEQLRALLAQSIEDHNPDLAARYLAVLREALFSSRAEVRPSVLKSFAADEVEVLLQFLRQAESCATAHGERLHQAGFHVGAIVKSIQVTRQFLLGHVESNQITPMLEIVDAFEIAVVEGFIQSIDNINEIERGQLERVLNALHQRGHN